MPTTYRSIVSILALCVLCSAVFLTMTLISPPAPLPVGASPTEFSAGRTMQDLAVIAREPHPMGEFPAHADVDFEFFTAGPVQFLVVEEKTGLPSFSGLSTQPQPGTMPSPGEFFQGVPTDFTAIYRDFMVEENHGREVP